MNSTHRSFVVGLLLVLGCTRPDPAPQAVPTARGVPVGEAVSAVIGPEGGSLTSGDGSLTVTLPPGALAAPQTVSMQPLEGEVPGKLGTSFRLEPEGLTFAEPATLTVHTTDALLEGTAIELVTLATQDERGVWKRFRQPEINAAAGTVSIRTHHFSDWSPIAGARLFPVRASVKAGEQLTLELEYCLEEEPEEEGDAVFLPIGYTCEKGSYVNSFARNWAVNGTNGGSATTGTILSSTPGQAMFSAPAKKPARNPVAVSVEYSDFAETARKLMLVSSVTIEDRSRAWSGTITLTESGSRSFPGASGFVGDVVETYSRSETVTVTGVKSVDGPSTTLELSHQARATYGQNGARTKEVREICQAGGPVILRHYYEYSITENLSANDTKTEEDTIYVGSDGKYSLYVSSLALHLKGTRDIVDKYTDGCIQHTYDSSSNKEMDVLSYAEGPMLVEGTIDPANPNVLKGRYVKKNNSTAIAAETVVEWSLTRE